MNILFTLCGRAGSKGIKNKNISQFCGKPLSFYTLSAIDLFTKQDNQNNFDVVLSTDSEELINIVNKSKYFPIDIIKRSPELSGDRTAKIDVIVDCLNKMEERRNKQYDVVIDLDLTSPLRKIADISNLLKTYVESKADIVFSVTTSRRSPYFNQVTKTDKGYKRVIESQYTSRQQAPVVYDMNASLYAYKPSFIKDGGNFNNGNCEIIEMEDTGVLDLDNISDFTYMQIIAGYLFNSREEYSDILKNIDG